MALLDNLRYDGGVAATISNAAEDASAEGKFGIPRFNGDPSALQEYLYRVRARAAREAHMDQSEVKKLGPLGLRLLEGLRGSAFKIAQQVTIEDLGKKEGHEQLLSLLERSLKPRKDLEARELYAAGSRDGGILSRQPGEAMSSYVMRRRAWWSYLQQLDDSLQVSENILAEQMLQNSGLTDDQKLMIRTTLHGKLSVDKVANELLNQHPRIQEREKEHHRKPFHHFAKDYKRDWKGRNGKGYSRSYAAIDDDETATPWDLQSQSLAGFTEDLGDVEWEDDDESYLSVTEDADHFMTEYMGWYVEEGLDLESEEACALAAEALQLEYEAYSVRSHAKGKGHGGFAGQRHFEVSGSLSLQEKRARLQQLKLKTECRKCGQKGHWSGDNALKELARASALGLHRRLRHRQVHTRRERKAKVALQRPEWSTSQCMKMSRSARTRMRTSATWPCTLAQPLRGLHRVHRPDQLHRPLWHPCLCRALLRGMLKPLSRWCSPCLIEVGLPTTSSGTS